MPGKLAQGISYLRGYPNHKHRQSQLRVGGTGKICRGVSTGRAALEPMKNPAGVNERADDHTEVVHGKSARGS